MYQGSHTRQGSWLLLLLKVFGCIRYHVECRETFQVAVPSAIAPATATHVVVMATIPSAFAASVLDWYSARLRPCCLSSGIAGFSEPPYIHTYIHKPRTQPTFSIRTPSTLPHFGLTILPPSTATHFWVENATPLLPPILGSNPPLTLSHFGSKVVSRPQPTCQPASQPLGLSGLFWVSLGLA